VGYALLAVGESSFVALVEAAFGNGTDVRGRHSVAAAQEVLGAERVDCVVSDAALPDASGTEVVTALRDAAPALPVVLAPETGSERLAVRATRLDGIDYVPSTAPDRGAEVRERVETLLGGDTEDGDVRLRSFKRAVDQAGHSIYITDTDGTVRYVNPAFEATTGYAAEQAVGRTPRILKSGEHSAAFYEDLWDTILAGDVWQNELVNHRADGSRYVINQTIAPIVVDGNIERFVAVNADITDRIEWEERLETLHDATREWLGRTSADGVADLACRQLADIFDAETVCVYCYDDEGDLAPAAFRGPEERAPDGCECPSGSFETDETRDVSRADGDPASELLLPAGDYGVARLTSPEPDAFDDTDVAIGRVFTANLEAVLDSVSTYQALKRQNERLDKFAGVVSHDLQNPLSVAMGFLDLLEERVGEDEDLQRVRSSLEHMDDIVDDVLWLASEAEEVGEREAVSLERAAGQSWSLVETEGAELAVEGDVEVEAAPDLLHRLLENLLVNAVEHGTGDGPDADDSVRVAVGPLAEGRGFYVADDGPGVPPDRRGDVFDAGHTTSESGTGFGLAIVQRIADGHGWSVDLEESAAGGARFEVRT